MMKLIFYILIILSFFTFSYAQDSSVDDENEQFLKMIQDKTDNIYKPKFSEYLKTIKITPSFYIDENTINKMTCFPLIGDKFKDADFAFVAGALSLDDLKEIDPSLTITKEIIKGENEFEFSYGEVDRYILSKPVSGTLARESYNSKQVLITSKIDHDGYCDFTRYYPVFQNPIKAVQENEIAILVLGLNPKQNIKITLLKNKGIFGLSFWVVDINADNIPDFIWGLDPGKGYTAYYGKYFSAYNLNGKWIIKTIDDSVWSETGC